MQLEPNVGAVPSPRHRRGKFAASLTLLFAVFSFIALAPAQASADTVEGKAVLAIGSGKAGKSLRAQNVRVLLVAPATAKRSQKVARVTAPVRGLSFAKGAKASLSGGLRFRKGKRQVRFAGLEVLVSKRGSTVRAKSGKRTIALFRTAGKSNVVAGKSVKFAGHGLKLTRPAAKLITKRLRLDHLAAGALGRASLNARIVVSEKPNKPDPEKPDPEIPGDPDPYFETCGISATSELAGSAPAAASLPTLTGLNTVGSDISWGVKTSLRGYVFGIAGVKGLQTFDGATRETGMNPTRGFVFPATPGKYAINDPVDTSDDQAVINGSGTVLFCNKPHGFRYSFSNPTIVIDGEDSRLVLDVDTNQSGVWTPTQRVDFATLDLDGIIPTYNYSGSEVTWSDIPATLTAGGASALCGGAGDNPCEYTEGTELDPITAQAKTPYDLGAGDAAAWDALANYVNTNLPFPLSDPTQGGCALTVPAGGDASAARTIDEHLFYEGTTTGWFGMPDQPADQPDLAGGTVVTGGGLDWGFRSSLRGSINGTGQFNLAGGATASHDYVGNGPGSVGSGGQMSGAGKFFTWPANATESYYDAGGAGDADDRLVLRTSGRVAFCQTNAAQLYAIVFSNPTVIIDGEDSRITIDVATRYRLSWLRATVDFATLDLGGATFNSVDDSGTTTVSWTFPDAVSNVGPVELTADGEKVARLLAASYVEGLGLDGAKIRASFPTPAP